LIYRHTALVHATYSINVVFLAITKAASPLLWRFSDAGPRSAPRHLHGAGIRKPSQWATCTASLKVKPRRIRR